MLFHDELPTDLVNNEFPLQLEATQQITRELNEAWDIEQTKNESFVRPGKQEKLKIKSKQTFLNSVCFESF